MRHEILPSWRVEVTARQETGEFSRTRRADRLDCESPEIESSTRTMSQNLELK